MAEVALILAVARLAGSLVQRLGQPRVIGEILGGLALGPTVLGHFSTVLFPSAQRSALGALATIGVSAFMFTVGSELAEPRERSRRRVEPAVVGAASVVVPFASGVALAPWLRPAQEGGVAFAVFLGVAMATTAVPVLGRILVERGLVGTQLGRLALASAAASDVVTWLALGVALAAAGSGSNWDVLVSLLLLGVLGAALRLGVRPVMGLLARQDDQILPFLAVGLLASAAATAAIGLHEIFGALIFGYCVPPARAGRARTAVEPVSTVLMPIFFVVAGLGVDARNIGVAGVVQLASVLAVAVGSKLIAVTGAGRALGFPSRPALGLAVLMNTRGLTELVVLEIGLQRHLLNTRLYTVLVLMALITTMATGPFLGWLDPDPELES